jgi:hypothetical protein
MPRRFEVHYVPLQRHNQCGRQGQKDEGCKCNGAPRRRHRLKYRRWRHRVGAGRAVPQEAEQSVVVEFLPASASAIVLLVRFGRRPEWGLPFGCGHYKKMLSGNFNCDGYPALKAADDGNY